MFACNIKNTGLFLVYIIIIKQRDYRVYVNQTHILLLTGNYMVLNVSHIIIM